METAASPAGRHPRLEMPSTLRPNMTIAYATSILLHLFLLRILTGVSSISPTKAMPHQMLWINLKDPTLSTLSQGSALAKLILPSSLELTHRVWLLRTLPMACQAPQGMGNRSRAHTPLCSMGATPSSRDTPRGSKGPWGRVLNSHIAMCSILLCCMISSIKTMLSMTLTPW